MTPENFERIRRLIVCPNCKDDLVFFDENATCKPCGKTYPIKGGKLYFITPLDQTDDLDIIKGRLKKIFGSFYHTVLRPCLSPSLPYSLRGYLMRSFDLKNKIVIDLGSGNHRVHPDVFTVDVVDYDNVDIVCDMRKLPFRSDSIDVFGSATALEHVPQLNKVLAEIDRATSPGGRSVHIIPFMYPFHASPNDFVRYTHAGAAHLFDDWRVVEQFTVAGPISVLNTVVVEFISIILALGNSRLQAPIYLLLSAVFSPIKLLDLFFVRQRAFLSVSAVILTDLEKPIWDLSDGNLKPNSAPS